MTMMRIINATRTTAPKDAPTIVPVGEELLLSSAVVGVSVDFTLSVDFAVVRMETAVKDPLNQCIKSFVHMHMNHDTVKSR